MNLHRSTRSSPLLAAVLALVAGGAVSLLASSAATESPEKELHWFKGNTHTHTLNSDGDASPGAVAHWYRDHGYDFLVLSDHNYRTEVEVLQKELDRERKTRKKRPFLLIPGEEVTDGFEDSRRKYALHVNGVDTTRRVGAQGGESVRDVLQRCIDAIHDAGGLPHVNHPNFLWSLTADDIASLRDLRHFEIYNGHPRVHNRGGGGSPSLEEMWDDILSRGRVIWGVAVDDAHHYREFAPHLANPGRGWIVVRAPELSRKAIVAALRRGDFYASTGVELDDVTMEERALRLRIRAEADFRYRTFFIGRGGEVLRVDTSLEPSFTLEPEGLYVRARVVSSGGERAWTQPFFPDLGEPEEPEETEETEEAEEAEE